MTALSRDLALKVQSFIVKFAPNGDSPFRADLYHLIQEAHETHLTLGYLVLESKRPWVTDEVVAAQFASRDVVPAPVPVGEFRVVADAIRAGFSLLAPPQPAYMPMGAGTVLISSGRFTWWLEKRSSVSP